MQVNKNSLTNDFTSRSISKGHSYYYRADIPMDQKHKRVVSQKDVNDIPFIDTDWRNIVIAVLVALFFMWVK